MNGRAAVGSQVASVYQGGAKNPSFADLRAGFDELDDDQLADLIENDGRLRLELSLSVDLDRYLPVIGDPVRHPVAIDAAIDMAMRALTAAGTARNEAATALTRSHPDLASAISEASALDSALWSTIGMQRHMYTTTARDLPCDFGACLPDGRARFELRELLGVGAFGQVYAAVDRLLSEQGHEAIVSIKVLAGSGRSDEARRLLIEEASKARRIDHPNVVRVLDRGVSADNEDYVVYEYVDGGDLSQWAAQHRPVPIRDAASTLVQVARGVHAAHMAGLVHCDLKPGNIVLTSEGVPKVVDFGIAKRADQDDDPAPDDEQPLGNLAFMSPEQFRREHGALTIPSDIYALGGVLYWMLTGRHPNGETADAIRRVHAGDAKPAPVNPRSLRPEVPIELELICRRALDSDPARRFNSAAGFADDVQAVLDLRPVEWTQPSRWRRMALWGRRKPWTAAMLTIMLMILVGSGVAVLHFSAVARQGRLDALLAQQEQEIEKSLREEYLGLLRKYLVDVKQMVASGESEEVLMQIWYMEWLYGPSTLGEGPDKLELWRHRLAAVRQLLAESRAKETSPGLETQTWEFALAFWLVCDGDYHEAEPLLRDNLAGWRSLLTNPDDQMLQDVATVTACAAVNRYRDQGGAPAEMATTLEFLQEAARVLHNRHSGSPLHRLVLESGVALSGPTLLDDAVAHDEFSRNLEALDPESESDSETEADSTEATPAASNS